MPRPRGSKNTPRGMSRPNALRAEAAARKRARNAAATAVIHERSVAMRAAFGGRMNAAPTRKAGVSVNGGRAPELEPDDPATRWIVVDSANNFAPVGPCYTQLRLASQARDALEPLAPRGGAYRYVVRIAGQPQRRPA